MDLLLVRLKFIFRVESFATSLQLADKRTLVGMIGPKVSIEIDFCVAFFAADVAIVDVSFCVDFVSMHH
jgi:hypothetical protein